MTPRMLAISKEGLKEPLKKVTLSHRMSPLTRSDQNLQYMQINQCDTPD